MSRVQGYNVALRLNGKTCVGRTQDDLNITPTLKDSLTKDDHGNKQSSVVGHEVTFRVSGLMEFDGTATSKLDSDALIAQSLKKGSEANIPITYERGSGQAYQGTAVMTSYSESTNAEDEGTYTLDLKITGDFTPVTSTPGTE